MNLVLGMMAMDFLLRRIAVVSVLALLPGVSAFPQSDRKDKKQAVSSELRIEVTAGDSGQPVVAAEVLVRYVPEPGSAGKKMEANVKTDARGIAQVSDIPAGKIVVQISAKGYRSFSRWYEHAEKRQTIQIQHKVRTQTVGSSR